MGLIISRFRRKKTTTEVLENLEGKIKAIEQDDQYKEQTHKRVLGYVMAYSVGLYVLFAVLYYYMYVARGQHWLHSLLYATPLLVLPVLERGCTLEGMLIKAIEQDDQYKEQTHKRVLGYVMAYSVGLYVLFAALYYYMYVARGQHWLHSLLYATPLLVLPVLVLFLRSLISWYYNWRLTKNRIKLSKMREEKKKILEEVMNTETYKVAKEILDKYGSPEEQSKALKPFVPSQNVPGNAPRSPAPATPGQLRQRQMALQSSTPTANNMMVPVNSPTALYIGPRLRSDQLPRPLAERNRSALDKVVDYLLKDGPNFRMALICSECFSHNGMAIAEEYEYVSYICAYCGRMNHAKKQRPAAPPLKPRALLPPQPGSGDESSVASSGSDSEDEKKNDIKATRSEGSDAESDRPPSPVEGGAKSDAEKKQD